MKRMCVCVCFKSLFKKTYWMESIYLLQNYLSQFGYLQPINPTSGGIISQDTLSKAISEFQAFAGLNITGESCIPIVYKVFIYVVTKYQGKIDTFALRKKFQ